MSERLGFSSAHAGFGVSPAEVMNDMTGMVHATVQRHRARGVKTAIWSAARELGLPTRRVRAYWHREARAVWAWEYEQVKQRFRRGLEESCARMEVECAEIRAQLRDPGD